MRAAEAKITTRRGSEKVAARTQHLRRSGVTQAKRNAGWQWASLLGGGALLGFGLLRRNKAGLASSVAGSALLYQGITMGQPGAGILARVSPEMETQRTVTINRSASELYRFWKDPSNFPKFMEHVESVTQTGPKTQHWVIRGPVGKKLEWDSDITADIHDKMIAWSTKPGSIVQHSGVIEFHPVNTVIGNETQVRLTISYRLPAGAVGSAIATVFGREPSQTARENLRRLKQLIETGEIATVKGQTHGRRGVAGTVMQAFLGEEPTRFPESRRLARKRVAA